MMVEYVSAYTGEEIDAGIAKANAAVVEAAQALALAEQALALAIAALPASDVDTPRLVTATWHDVTMINGAVATPPPRYCKIGPTVYLCGMVGVRTTSNYGPCFNMPQGYRPSDWYNLGTTNSNSNKTCTAQISPSDGSFVFNTQQAMDATGFYCFSVSYPAES